MSAVSLTLLAAALLVASQPGDMVVTVRAERLQGIVELSTAVTISPRHAITMGLFEDGASVGVETAGGFISPDSVIRSPDLGLVILEFGSEVFESYDLPSSEGPAPGDRLTLVGQDVGGVVTVEATAIERGDDGAVLLSTSHHEGMMGAAAFDEKDVFVGLVTGLVQPTGSLEPRRDDLLVLYPSLIWYMWAELVVSGVEYAGPPFGVTAMASFATSESRPAGVHLVSVTEGSTAWAAGLRPGDLITHVCGGRVYHPETLRGLLLMTDDSLDATVWTRQGERSVMLPPLSRD